MLSVRIKEALEERLAELTNKTHRSKSYYVERALEQFLDEYEEYLIALSKLEEEGPNVSLDEVKKQLGLDDE